MRAILVSCVAVAFALAAGGATASHYSDMAASELVPATHAAEGAMTPSVLRLGVRLPTLPATPATAQQPAATTSKIPTLWRDLIIGAVAVVGASAVAGVALYSVSHMHHQGQGGRRIRSAH